MHLRIFLFLPAWELCTSMSHKFFAVLRKQNYLISAPSQFFPSLFYFGSFRAPASYCYLRKLKKISANKDIYICKTEKFNVCFTKSN